MLASFTTLDWVIVVAYLGLSVAIGLMANRFITGLSGYLVAGRSLGTALSIAAMTGSELGLITVMYQAEKGFGDGFSALHIAVLAGVVPLVVGLTGFLVVRLRRMGVMTIPEFYRRRFSRRVQIVGGITLAVGGILNMGMFLKIGSMFLVAATGLDADGTTVKLVMVALLALVLLYTVLGGMVSVVLTDYIQFVVLSLGLVLMVIFTLNRLGMDSIVESWQQAEGLKAFDPVEGHGPSYMSWQLVLGLVNCAIWPTAVTRALSARDEGVVKRQYALSSLSFMIRFLIPCFMGIAAFTFLLSAGAVIAEDHKTFEFAGEAYKAKQAFPVMLREMVPIGVLGLLTAAMLAAFMSTHDSYLLCWASVIARDVVNPIKGDQVSEKTQLLVTRIGIVVIGLIVLVFGMFYPLSDDLWDYLSVTGAIYFTGAIAVLICGLYWKRASSAGAIAALLTGCLAILGMGPIRKEINGLLGTALDGAEVGLITVSISLAAMVAGSLLWPDRPQPETAEEAA